MTSRTSQWMGRWQTLSIIFWVSEDMCWKSSRRRRRTRTSTRGWDEWHWNFPCCFRSSYLVGYQALLQGHCCYQETLHKGMDRSVDGLNHKWIGINRFRDPWHQHWFWFNDRLLFKLTQQRRSSQRTRGTWAHWESIIVFAEREDIWSSERNH